MSVLYSAVTFFPRLVVAVPSYAITAALGGGKRTEQLCIEDRKDEHFKGIVVEEARNCKGENTSNPHADDGGAAEASTPQVPETGEDSMFSWLYRRWSPLREKNLHILQDGEGYADEILERYLHDQIRLLEQDGANASSEPGEGMQTQAESAQLGDHHDECEDSLVCASRDSVSSGAFSPHAGELEELRHELYELRASQQQYDQAWWDYGLKLCSLGCDSWHQPLPLVAFSVRPPLFNMHLQFEFSHGVLARSRPWIKLWNFGLDLKMVQPKDKSPPGNEDEC